MMMIALTPMEILTAKWQVADQFTHMTHDNSVSKTDLAEQILTAYLGDYKARAKDIFMHGGNGLIGNEQADYERVQNFKRKRKLQQQYYEHPSHLKHRATRNTQHTLG